LDRSGLLTAQGCLHRRSEAAKAGRGGKALLDSGKRCGVTGKGEVDPSGLGYHFKREALISGLNGVAVAHS
jgi:hypothetical protein